MTAVNDAPTLTGVPASLTYARQTAAIAIAPAAAFSDIDNSNMLGAIITIQSTGSNVANNRLELAGGYTINGANQLVFNSQVIGNVSSDGVGANALTINITATLTVANVQSLLQNVVFRTVGATAPFSTTLNITVTDPLSSSTGIKSINVSVT